MAKKTLNEAFAKEIHPYICEALKDAPVEYRAALLKSINECGSTSNFSRKIASTVIPEVKREVLKHNLTEGYTVFAYNGLINEIYEINSKKLIKEGTMNEQIDEILPALVPILTRLAPLLVKAVPALAKFLPQLGPTITNLLPMIKNLTQGVPQLMSTMTQLLSFMQKGNGGAGAEAGGNMMGNMMSGMMGNMMNGMMGGQQQGQQ